MDGSGFESPYRQIFFSLVLNGSGTHVISYLEGIHVLSGVRAAGGDAGRLSPSSAEVTNEWSYTSTPCVGLNGVDRNSFTLCVLSF